MPAITYAIIGITVALSLYAWKDQSKLKRWIFNPYSIAHHNQYDRFLTSGFIHNDYSHLIFNMFTLFFFGPAVESELQTLMPGATGSALYIALYLIGIIFSGIPSYIKHKEHAYYNSLGASGGVSTILFASILLIPSLGIYLLFIPVEIPGWLFAILYRGYSFYASHHGKDNINHDAHLWGALFGLVFIILLDIGLGSENIIGDFMNHVRTNPFNR
ncbi:MAG: rhomboid family intramembrane serine protease [Cyclobacteriaceae bacterium]